MYIYIYITLYICHPHSSMYYEPIKSWDRTTGHPSPPRSAPLGDLRLGQFRRLLEREIRFGSDEKTRKCGAPVRKKHRKN